MYCYIPERKGEHRYYCFEIAPSIHEGQQAVSLERNLNVMSSKELCPLLALISWLQHRVRFLGFEEIDSRLPARLLLA